MFRRFLLSWGFFYQAQGAITTILTDEWEIPQLFYSLSDQSELFFCPLSPSLESRAWLSETWRSNDLLLSPQLLLKHESIDWPSGARGGKSHSAKRLTREHESLKFGCMRRVPRSSFGCPAGTFRFLRLVNRLFVFPKWLEWVMGQCVIGLAFFMACGYLENRKWGGRKKNENWKIAPLFCLLVSRFQTDAPCPKKCTAPTFPVR